MARAKSGRKNGSGTLEKHNGIWRARWVVDGKRFLRSTGEKVSGGKQAYKAALDKLEAFTSGYELKETRKILEIQVAKLSGVDREIEEHEAQKPALRFMEAWTVYRQSQNRPRSGAATLRNYELQYFQFVDWVKNYHADILELRHVSKDIAEEYAQFMLAGTPKDEREKITQARKWLYSFDYKRKQEAKPRTLSEDEQAAIDRRREIAARTIREPVRGGTFNKHLNALALIWRIVSQNDKARIAANPWAFDKGTGTGIKRITLNHGERPHARRTLTIEEVYNILKTAKGELRGLIAIGFYTGLRLGDAVLLDWGSIDRVRGIITVRSRKTDTVTRAAIHPALANILQEEVKTKRGYLLPQHAELYLSGKSGRVQISNEIIDLFESVGIATKYTEEGRRARNDCGFHSLRHTFVTAIRERGATLQTAQQLAGHNTERMTEHYTHDSERAVLALPDVTDAATARAATSPAALPFVGAARAEPDTQDTGAAVATPSQGERPAACLTVAELKAALAGLSDTERGELLKAIGGK